MPYSERPRNTQQEIHFRITLQSAKWGLTMMHHRPSSDLQNYGFRGGSTGLQQIWNCFETMTVFPSGQTCQLWLQQTRKLFTIPSFIQFQHTVVCFFTSLQSHGVIHYVDNQEIIGNRLVLVEEAVLVLVLVEEEVKEEGGSKEGRLHLRQAVGGEVNDEAIAVGEQLLAHVGGGL